MSIRSRCRLSGWLTPVMLFVACSKGEQQSTGASTAAASAPAPDVSLVCSSGHRVRQQGALSHQFQTWIVVTYAKARPVCIGGDEAGMTGVPVAIVEGQNTQVDLGVPQDYKPADVMVSHGGPPSQPVTVVFAPK